jgi:hypothetical protein
VGAVEAKRHPQPSEFSAVLSVPVSIAVPVVVAPPVSGVVVAPPVVEGGAVVSAGADVDGAAVVSPGPGSAPPIPVASSGVNARTANPLMKPTLVAV